MGVGERRRHTGREKRMKYLYILILIFCLNDYAYGYHIRGKARIIDGDTIEIDDNNIRLEYIDAPEIRQKCCTPEGHSLECGKTSRDLLKHLTEDGEVTCFIHGEDRYKRLLGQCYANNVDVQQQLVKEGMAFLYHQNIKKNPYYLDELRARLNKQGIWNTEFVKPHFWRRKKRASCE